MMLGPLLARFGVAYIPKPGGDKIGRRRLDTHFLGFESWEPGSISPPERWRPKSCAAPTCCWTRRR